MEVENVNIYDLIPSKIIELIEKLTNALNVIKIKKDTLYKVANFEKSKSCCPHCGSNNIIKNGFTKVGHIQNYKCRDCNKKFNDLTNSVFAGTKLNYEQIDIFLDCFKDRISIRRTAKRMNVNPNTVFLLRHKILSALACYRENIKLTGEIESDEIYRTVNLKGTKSQNMPRTSKPRTSKGTTVRGISKHKVCISTAIDEYDNCFLEIVGTGEITSEMVKKSLTPKLVNVKTLTTDCKSSYESEAKNNNWNLVQIKSNGHVNNEGRSLANINSLHSGLSTFLSNFRGVSTKHLQGYLDWYMFNKKLNYSYEDDKQKEIILKSAILNSTNIITSNMYENQSGINFFDLYSDYNYVPTPLN